MGPTPVKRQKHLVEPPADDGVSRKRRQIKRPRSNRSDRNGAEVELEKDGTGGRRLTTRSRGKTEHLEKSTIGAAADLPSTTQNAKQKARTKDVSSKSLYTFFTPSSQGPKSPAEDRVLEQEDIEEDAIEDDFSEEESNLRRPSQSVSTEQVKGEQLPKPSRFTAIQKFLKPSFGGSGSASSNAKTSSSSSGVDCRPWAEKYGPVSLDELAVHKKKVSDVREWLYRAIKFQNSKKLLVLKGPSGSGKTTTLSLLSAAAGLDILEWRNPTGTEFSSDGYVSASKQFEDFIGRGGKFGSLEFAEGDGPLERKSLATEEPNQMSGKPKILLVEEFPSTLTRQSAALQNFRSTVLQYLASSGPGTGNTFELQGAYAAPLVMVISETLLTTSTAAADSFTAHRLLGPQIMTHPGVSIIEFNPIAPTFLSKALDLIIKKEARVTGRRKSPSPMVLKTLGAVGDIRSAVASLEFLCLRGDEAGDWGGRVAFTTKRKKGVHEDMKLTRMERDSLELVTQREASFGIFHAVGKVVYNKREDPAVNPSLERPPQPPNHLPQHHRPKVSEVSVDTLIDATGTDTQTFIAALHENYILSCDNSSSEDAMDSVNGCIDAISDSDLLSPNWTGGFGSGHLGGGFGRGAYQGASSDSLRQDEMSFQLAVYGILFALPYPVKRRAPPPSLSTGGSGSSTRDQGNRLDAHKMFFPTSLRLWRCNEELTDMIDLYLNHLMRGQLTEGFSTTGSGESGGVETWKRNLGFFNSSDELHGSSNSASTSPSELSLAANPVFLSSGNSARREMILERLPYTALIERKRNKSSSFGLRELEQITSFKGVGGPSIDIPDDEGDEDTISSVRDWTTDNDSEYLPGSRFAPPSLSVTRGLPTRRRLGQTSITADVRSKIPGLSFESQVQKLVLSDDDIEDD